jgi:hypothetical protein
LHDSFLLVLFICGPLSFLPANNREKVKKERGEKGTATIIDIYGQLARLRTSSSILAEGKLSPRIEKDRRLKRGVKQDLHWGHRVEYKIKNAERGRQL